MNMPKIYKIHVLVIICLAISVQLVCAAGIKDRMKQRLPVILDLKTKGIVGESNRGYVEFVGSVKANEDVVAAENKDRKAVYMHFAKQQKTTLDVVEKVQGKRKAQIAQKTPGHYYQTKEGAWVKK